MTALAAYRKANFMNAELEHPHIFASVVYIKSQVR